MDQDEARCVEQSNASSMSVMNATKQLLFFCVVFANLWLIVATSPKKHSPYHKATNPSFVGAWKWQSKDEVFHLNIERTGEAANPEGKVFALYSATYVYSKANKVIEESESEKGKDLRLVGALPLAKVDNVTMELQYRDTIHHKQGRAVISFSKKQVNTVNWRLQNAYETVSVNKSILPGFTLPICMKLERAN